jgi:hypothetical protein
MSFSSVDEKSCSEREEISYWRESEVGVAFFGSDFGASLGLDGF